MTQLKLGDIEVDVIRKDIKNVHLSVHPPTGAVRISAPLRMNMDAIRLFAISKLPWIKQHQKKLAAQDREPPRDYVDRESHYVWGKRYLLKLVEHNGAPEVVLKHNVMELRVRSDLPVAKRELVIDAWYRKQLRLAIPPLLEKWQRVLGVEVRRFFVQRMKTKWGSSSPHRSNIRLNAELAKKAPDCLEYVVIHELSHFLSPRHDKCFIATLDQHLPHWRSIRERLNASSLRHESWRRSSPR